MFSVSIRMKLLGFLGRLKIMEKVGHNYTEISKEQIIDLTFSIMELSKHV